MPTTVSQKIFDQLLDSCICSPDAAGWTLDSAGTRPSVTVTSEVVLALIDAAMSSAIAVPADFPKRLNGPIAFIMADVLARDSSTLDLANYIRALSAYQTRMGKMEFSQMAASYKERRFQLNI